MECVERSATAKYQVGTSGFMVTPKQWSKMSCLNCIEVNSSFYRIPTDNTIKSLQDLPPHINVVMKASKYITHVKRLKDVGEAWSKLWAQISKLKERLSGVLVQLPPSFARNAVNEQRLRDLKKILPDGLNIAVEFRNRSWLQTEVYALMRQLGWCVVGTYIVKRDTTNWVGDMPSGLYVPPKTASFNYMRIHGKKGWKGELNKSELDAIQDSLSSQSVMRSYVMFNNTFFDPRSKSCQINGSSVKYAAVCNAVEFAGSISKKTRRNKKLNIISTGGTKKNNRS